MSPIIGGGEGEEQAILETARFMQVAARTAPKAYGIDDIYTLVVYGEEKDAIAKKMEEIGEERKIDLFRRDAKNVRDSKAVLLIGVKGDKSIGVNCGACGYRSCKEFDEAEKRAGQDFTGPTCIFKAINFGIAIGSAVKIASILNVDNRVMYRVGAAAMKMGLIPEATIILGIPLSAKGKNIYFDRIWP
ncbi:MAG: DUF2148 domain-containing protein [Candidatus Bathyarchaeia archaeon]